MATGEQKLVDAEAGTARQLVLGAILVSFTNPKGLIASILIYPVFRAVGSCLSLRRP